MCEFETQKKEQEKRTMTDKQNEMCYWGWKFEQYVTAGVYYLSIIYVLFMYYLKVYLFSYTADVTPIYAALSNFAVIFHF